MAKDPAFLFYPQDFLTGTMFMTNEQVGIYIKLLCAQHQHGGMISKSAFNSLVNSHEIIRDKFIEVEDGFFNERLMAEIEKRAKKSTNLSANAKIRWEKQKQCKSNAKAYAEHVPIENENENENERVVKVVNKRKEQILEYCKIQNYPAEEGEAFYDHYQALGWQTSAGMGIVDWKAKMRTWHKEQIERDNKNGTKTSVRVGAKSDELARISTERAIRNKG